MREATASVCRVLNEWIEVDWVKVDSELVELRLRAGSIRRIWGGYWGSNPGHPLPQSGVLPLNYNRHIAWIIASAR